MKSESSGCVKNELVIGNDLRMHTLYRVHSEDDHNGVIGLFLSKFNDPIFVYLTSKNRWYSPGGFDYIGKIPHYKFEPINKDEWVKLTQE